MSLKNNDVDDDSTGTAMVILTAEQMRIKPGAKIARIQVFAIEKAVIDIKHCPLNFRP